MGDGGKCGHKRLKKYDQPYAAHKDIFSKVLLLTYCIHTMLLDNRLMINFILS